MHYISIVGILISIQMEGLVIREAQTEDLNTLLEFEQALVRAERPFDECIRQDPVHYYDLQELIEDPNVAVVVADYKGEIVSSGSCRAKRARIYLDHQEYAYLGFMYTLPEYRGRGFNKQIIEYLANWALKRDLYELRLTVYDENTPAVQAYEKAGFTKHIVVMRMRKL